MSDPDPLQVDANEYGRVRVFTADLPPEGASAITPNNITKLIGADVIPRKVEIVPSGVFNEMGLTQYLVDGYGVAERELEGRRAALDAVSGLVILLPSSAFGGAEVTLTPDPLLRLVGMFSEEAERAHDLSRQSAPAEEIKPADGSSRPSPQGRTGSSMIALGALIIAAALLLFYVMN